MNAIILTLAALVSSSWAGGLSNSYLPPFHGSASSFAPTYSSGYSSGGFIQAASAPVRQYAAPAVISHGHNGGYGSVGRSIGYVQAASAPVVHYSAPARTVVAHGNGGYSGGFIGAASTPVRHYAVPASISHSYGGYNGGFTGAASTPVRHYAAPAVSHSYGGYNGGFTGAASTPVRHYAAPAVVSYAATAPVSSYLPPASHVGTQYAANGGYVRQK